MNVALRLGLFGLGLLVTFAVMYVVGRALVPASTVDRWVEEAARPAREHQAMPAETMRVSVSICSRSLASCSTAV